MSRSAYLPFVIVICLLMVGCAEGDTAEAEDNTDIRSDIITPQFPSRTNNSQSSNNGQNQGDNNQINNSNNSTNNQTNNGTSGTNGTNGDGCPAESCLVGVTQCQGELEQTCEADANNPGCGIWGTGLACASPQQTCVGMRCDIPEGCVDNDGDGHGLGCAAGPDCDDADGNNYPDNTEVCDGLDNDCNSIADDNLGLGSSCTEGSGQCAFTGITACDDQGMIFCDAQGAAGEPEVCDGLDNDCDGVADNGGVCDSCASDINEPNETVTTGKMLNPDTRLAGAICPNDAEFFELNVSAGVPYRLILGYPELVSDLDLKIYGDGVLMGTFSSTVVGREGVLINPVANKTYVAEVVNNGDPANFFFINLLENFACDGEDFFSPNQTPADAPFLLSYWRPRAYICAGTSDWFYLGVLSSGQTFQADLWNLDPTGDLDLHIWGDVYGTGTPTIAISSAFNGTDESISALVTTTTEYWLEVRDWDGIGDAYEVSWASQ